jgi:hypothetical protein
VIARVLYLIVATAVFWVVTVVPARYLWGDVTAVHAGVAVLLCLIPALLTLVWVGRTLRHDPQQAGLLALGASGVRMFAVLVAAVLLYTQVPLFHEAGFLFWVLAAYLYTLAVEIVLLVRGTPAVREKVDRGA